MATGGNLKAGGAAATLTSVGTLAVNPQDAVRNAATAVETVRTIGDAYKLVLSTIESLSAPLIF